MIDWEPPTAPAVESPEEISPGAACGRVDWAQPRTPMRVMPADQRRRGPLRSLRVSASARK